ncbi:MAG: hypothetical protein IT210_00215 [Armatimonadetes bacterium]|nr:hypothetical protein [Armatimonadota bacterium]
MASGTPGTHWYVSDGYIRDTLPVRSSRRPQGPLECASRLFLFNPGTEAARARVRFFHTDRLPTHIELAVGPGKIEAVDLSVLNEIPRNRSFWIEVAADLPIFPQARHEDYTFWDPVPDAMSSPAPYPGPLTDETEWVFADCYQGATQSWYEEETLTILNPGPEPVEASIRYLMRYFDAGGEETIAIPPERVASLALWERHPRMIGRPGGPPVRVTGDYAVRIEATGPVVAQTTRRARWIGFGPVIGSRSTMGFPIRKAPPSIWHYPGGNIIDRGILPRASASDHPLNQCDNAWNLLFIHNLSQEEPVEAQVAFHQADGAISDAPSLSIPPAKSILESLHAAPWLGTHTHLGQPYAITARSGHPVVPEVCGAEFEMWSQVCPGAMTAVNFYPGPLTDETVWWLGAGQTGGSDAENVEWEQSYHLFNPGETEAHITLTFSGFGPPVEHSVAVPPGAVACVLSSEIDGLPFHTPFAVIAAGDAPFCVQVFTRAYTRGLPHTRSMASMMGVPIRNGESE